MVTDHDDSGWREGDSAGGGAEHRRKPFGGLPDDRKEPDPAGKAPAAGPGAVFSARVGPGAPWN